MANKLTPKQLTFANCYMKTGNAYKSAIEAGYSENYAKGNVIKLLENVSVKKYIEEVAKATSDTAIMTIKERKEWLTKLINDKEENTSSRLKAVDIMNKMDGAYIEKVEMTGNINNPFAELTTEELKKLVDDE